VIFTYKGYLEVLLLLRENGYVFSDYSNYGSFSKPVILRHDVDFSIQKALSMALLEAENDVRSTYFVLLSTNFYNVFSRESTIQVKEILGLGHNIGLHFDETVYDVSDLSELGVFVKKEIFILEDLLDSRVDVVSMHRPSQAMLESDLCIDGVINSYSKEFFREFKYVSDSRMHCREDIYEVIESQSWDKLHILTHPFWFSETEETMKEKLIEFIRSATKERYNNLKDNFRNLEADLSEDEIP